MSDSPHVPPEEITPASLFPLNRRDLLRFGVAAASVVATGATYRRLNRVGSATLATPKLAGLQPAPSGPAAIASGVVVDESKTPLENIISYNNFYEFTTDKEGVARAAVGFSPRPWQVAVEGMVHKPRVFDIDEILNSFPAEDRVYRMRCVEGWSMVIPWAGFPLARLLDRVEPMGKARFVAFESSADPARFPNIGSGVLPWPYAEGLRIDEAMHPLTILAVGLYGRELPAQNGAPLRLVVPWKYGFKGIKSIVRITLRETMPPTTWSSLAPHEYGFYANVNPEVAHPRWSQATEQRIGESGRRPTLPFNGYAEQVAHLYNGLDLRANF